MGVTDSLSQNPQAILRRDQGRTWIDTVCPLGWGRGRDCTFIGALESALGVTEHPFSYTQLMGYTALAFRVRWCNPQTGGWDLTCAVGEYPEEYHALIQATGWTLPVDFSDLTLGGAEAEQAISRMVDSIDQGWPILAHIADHDIGVIAGYADRGSSVLAYRYSGPAELTQYPLSEVGGFRIFLGEQREPADSEARLLASLRTAVANWHRERGDGGIPGRDFFYGEAAMYAWMDDLAHADPKAMPPADLQRLYEVSHFAYRTLVDARAAAARYLAESAKLLAPAERIALWESAAIYESESVRLAQALRDGTVPSPHGENASPSTRWSAGQRAVQRSLLHDALAAEHRAISALESVLDP